MRSIVTIEFYELLAKSKKKRPDMLRRTHAFCVEDLQEGEIKREVLEVQLPKDQGIVER